MMTAAATRMIPVCSQAHVHGDAWRPEDEQPHSDEHHAGSLPGGPQDPGGVPGSHHAHLMDASLYAHRKLWSRCGSET